MQLICTVLSHQHIPDDRLQMPRLFESLSALLFELVPTYAARFHGALFAKLESLEGVLFAKLESLERSDDDSQSDQSSSDDSDIP